MTRYPGTGPSIAITDGNTDPSVHLDLYFDSDCPNAELLRTRLLACLAERDLAWQLHEHRDEHRLSPTLLVDGADVLPARPPGTGCRLDLPDRDDICRALDAVR